jgi:hypothetical protein
MRRPRLSSKIEAAPLESRPCLTVLHRRRKLACTPKRQQRNRLSWLRVPKHAAKTPQHDLARGKNNRFCSEGSSRRDASSSLLAA